MLAGYTLSIHLPSYPLSPHSTALTALNHSLPHPLHLTHLLTHPTQSSGGLKQSFVEPGHLGITYTCIAWRQEDGASSAGKRGGGLGLIALGTAQGSIVVWNLDEGKVEHRLGGADAGQRGRVNGVCFGQGGRSVFSCSDGKHALEWDLGAGTVARQIKIGKSGASSIIVSNDGTMLATATSKVAVWDLSSGQSLVSFPGHEMPVAFMRFTEDDKFLLTASDDRVPQLWGVAEAIDGTADVDEASTGKGSSAASASKHRSNRTPAMTFAMDGAAVAVCMKSVKRGRGCSYSVLLTSDSGAAHLWKVNGSDLSEQKRRSGAVDASRCCIRVADDEDEDEEEVKGGGVSKDDKVIAAAFVANDAGQVLVAHGRMGNPTFHTVEVATARKGLRADVSVPAVASKDLLSSESVQASKAHGKASPGQGEEHVTGHTKRAAPLDMSAAAENGGDGEGAQSRKARRVDSTEGEMSEGSGATLGERVASLAADLNIEVESDDEAPSREQESRAQALVAEEYGGRHVPKAKSIAAVIDQAIQVDDDALLEYCLATRDTMVIRASVGRLKVTRVLPFLKKLVGKLEARPSRGSDLIAWIRSVFELHTAYLMGAPGKSPCLEMNRG